MKHCHMVQLKMTKVMVDNTSGVARLSAAHWTHHKSVALSTPQICLQKF